ncbi:MAG: 1-deoxy-D-xylulose-5-phosphate reductoisomerase [Halieaceae bacterium]|nr:MAG: 1-deoxy-D-xylulose-5-phosphate reductoisomerase [Halieaceae bacterium]
MRRIAVLGATGSIGRSTLDVIRRHSDRYQVTLLSAHRSVDDMEVLCRAHQPTHAVMGDPDAAAALAERLTDLSAVTVESGAAVLDDLVAEPNVDSVVAGIVGFAGLRPTLSAARAGKTILLANKEALVSAGGLFMETVRQGGATLLPVDSEHNAMHQCLPVASDGRPDMADVEKIILTASGGPFRGRSRSSLDAVTPAEACAHPNWSMGQKISVDSATLANKGLELAEACWLFDRSPDEIEIVVHPQSIVHSMIRYRDGSVLAQLGQPDMRTPIAYCLAWPERVDAGVEALDIVSAGRLDFEAPDLEAFPCLALAQWAITQPGGMCVFSAANEIAVAAFLSGEIRFTDIHKVIDAALKATDLAEPDSLDAVQALDQMAREAAQQSIASGLTRSGS